MQKAKDKEKAAKYYIKNKEILKKNAKNSYRNLSEEEKEVKRLYGRNRYRNMTEDEKNRLKDIKEAISCQKKKKKKKKKIFYIITKMKRH